MRPNGAALCVAYLWAALIGSAGAGPFSRLSTQLDREAGFEENMARVRQLAKGRLAGCLAKAVGGRWLRLERLVELEAAAKTGLCDPQSMELARSVRGQLGQQPQPDDEQPEATDWLTGELLSRFAAACRAPLREALLSEEALVGPEVRQLVRRLGSGLLDTFNKWLWKYYPRERADYLQKVDFLREPHLRHAYWPVRRLIESAAKSAADADAHHLSRPKHGPLNTEALARLFDRYVVEPCKLFLEAHRGYGPHAVLQFPYAGSEAAYDELAIDYRTCSLLVEEGESVPVFETLLFNLPKFEARV